VVLELGVVISETEKVLGTLVEQTLETKVIGDNTLCAIWVKSKVTRLRQ